MSATLSQPSEILDRIPPHSAESERAVVGSILVDPARLDEVSLIVRPSDFYFANLGHIFEHLLAFPFNGDGSADLTALLAWIRKPEEVEKLSPVIAELFDLHPSPRHAADYARVVRGLSEKRRLIRLHTDGLQAAYGSENGTAELVADVRGQLDEIEQGTASDRFQTVSCEELAAGNYNVTYLVRDVLVENVPCMIGGQLKTLKTLVAIGLALSLATGEPFLGVFPVMQTRRVVYFIGEGGLSIAKDYACRIAASLQVELADVAGLTFCDQVPQLGDAAELDAMAAVLRGHAATIAILDPLYLAMDSGRDSGNIMAMGPIFRNFNRVCAKAAATPIIVHHLRKNRATLNRNDPPELAELSWSGAAEFAGQWLLLSRESDYDADNPGRHDLYLSVGGRAGHGSLNVLRIDEGRHTDLGGRKWEVEVVAPREARQDARERTEEVQEERRQAAVDRDKEKVCRAMAKFPAGETKNTLRTRAGMSGTRFETALAALLDDGAVVECEVTKGNRKEPYQAYVLAES